MLFPTDEAEIQFNFIIVSSDSLLSLLRLSYNMEKFNLQDRNRN